MPISERWTLHLCPICGHGKTYRFGCACRPELPIEIEVVPAAEIERLREVNNHLRDTLRALYAAAPSGLHKRDEPEPCSLCVASKLLYGR